MLRWLATVLLLALLLLTFVLPGTGIGRRGAEAAVRQEAAGSSLAVGQAFPALALRDIDGADLSWDRLRGHRVLLTFERSVDW